MAFDWSNFGQAPSADQFEISTFGPGYGECCVLHVGEGRWVVVDSCLDSTDRVDRRPVAEKYLRALGVDIATQVDLVVATHWHSDHVRGIGRVLEQAASAQFCCSVALLDERFHTYIEQFSTAAMATDGAKVSDFRDACRVARARQIAFKYAVGNRTLKSWSNGGAVTLRSLSPSDTEYQVFLQSLASLLPQHGQPKRSAASQDENLCAVVLHLQTENFSALLGSDLEVHHDARRGWNAVVKEAQDAMLSTSSLWKVPHHGSINGHHEDTLRNMLGAGPISVVTPFNKLTESKKLPTQEDRARILGYSSQLFATAPTSRQQLKGVEASVARSLRESGIDIRKAGSELGAVRCRWKLSTGWTTELFGVAHQVLAQ